jgi:hypothetical protein
MKSLLSGQSGIRLVGRSETHEVWHGSFYGVSMHVDAIAADPPWRQGNLTYWSRQANTEQNWTRFVDELIALVVRSNPKVVYLKVGVPECGEWCSRLGKFYGSMIQWETTYYGGKNAQIVASSMLPIGDIEQAEKSPEATNLIADWMRTQGIATVGDCCGGKGEMLNKFRKRGMRVVATELVESRAGKCHARLSK